jgi:hypothetical protein
MRSSSSSSLVLVSIAFLLFLSLAMLMVACVAPPAPTAAPASASEASELSVEDIVLPSGITVVESLTRTGAKDLAGADLYGGNIIILGRRELLTDESNVFYRLFRVERIPTEDRLLYYGTVDGVDLYVTSVFVSVPFGVLAEIRRDIDVNRAELPSIFSKIVVQDTESHIGIGFPHIGKGGPYGVVTGTLDYEAFLNQWAFTSTGILSDSVLTAPGGAAKVIIGIFDTSPFVDKGAGSDLCSTIVSPTVEATGKFSFTWPVQIPLSNISTESMSITIKHGPPEDLLCVVDGGTNVDMRDHGLFVASIIHRIAPDAELYLYRVLNREGRGMATTLLAALTDFKNNVLSPTNGSKVVVSLSLGFRPPKVGQEEFEQRRYMAELISGDQEQELAALGIVAAGNENDGVPFEGNGGETVVISPYDYLAHQSNLIGVGADWQQGTEACYSNTAGIVWAPGGGDEDCAQLEEKLEACVANDDQNCAYAVIGLAIKKDNGQRPLFQKEIGPQNFGYGYWVGTSFATAFYSGLAAHWRASDLRSPTDLITSIAQCGGGKFDSSCLSPTPTPP